MWPSEVVADPRRICAFDSVIHGAIGKSQIVIE
jgi:hypothetical protein